MNEAQALDRWNAERETVNRIARRIHERGCTAAVDGYIVSSDEVWALLELGSGPRFGSNHGEHIASIRAAAAVMA